MSRTKTTPSNLSVGDAGTPRTVAERHDPAPKSRFRPEVTEAEKRHPQIVSEFSGREMLDAELPPEQAVNPYEAVSVFDLDPHSRTITMLPRQPRRHFGTRRERPTMIRPKAYRELEIPCFDEISGSAPVLETEAPRARNELEDFFSDIESVPAPRPSWGGRLLGLFVSAWSFLRREREISRSIAALSEMDDRTLRDIGIHHRLQIPEIVRHGRQWD